MPGPATWRAGRVRRERSRTRPPAGRVLQPDVGIARILDSVSTLASTRAVIGTPQYMPPEQLNGQPVVASGDLWALGATLYAAVEGRPPYTGDSLMALVTSVLTRPLPPPVHAGPLISVITRLLTRGPSKRPTAADTARRLRAPGSTTSPDLGGIGGDTPPEAEPTRPGGNRQPTPEPMPTWLLTDRASADSSEREHRPASQLAGQPPAGRGLLTRRNHLGATLAIVTLGGGLAALPARNDPPASPPRGTDSHDAVSGVPIRRAVPERRPVRLGSCAGSDLCRDEWTASGVAQPTRPGTLFE
ncbi:hypothetical protein [Streptomyces sp. NPDC056921]|uniref:protein kinase domain-containing protein n=1 Tax=Streptomyces sp. NPDC056921 TaxID=3345966 RepID=UPI00363CC59D